jgi:8-oxo-dGTP diphosphatase
MKCITVSAAVIVNAQQQILLVRKHNTAFFMQVGGKLEPNESAEAALLREVEEETGSTATIQQFIGRFETAAANEANHLLVSYLYWVELDQVPQIQAEIAELCWLDLAAIPEQALLAPLTKEIVIPWCQQHFFAMA